MILTLKIFLILNQNCMKKVFFSLLALVAISVSVSSCKKCQTCTFAGTADIEVCEDDFGSKTLYDASISAYELTGWIHSDMA